MEGKGPDTKARYTHIHTVFGWEECVFRLCCHCRAEVKTELVFFSSILTSNTAVLSAGSSHPPSVKANAIKNHTLSSERALKALNTKQKQCATFLFSFHSEP